MSNVAFDRPRSVLEPRPRSRRRRVSNAVATGAIVAAFLVALVPLVLIVGYVVQRGGKELSWGFLTKPIPFSDRLPGGGMGPAVAGTLVITGVAAAMAIPLGVLGGIYLNEYGGKSPVARLVRFLAEVMTGVPCAIASSGGSPKPS